jgi:hypothetical protein
MQLLEYFYDRNNDFFIYHERKCSLSDNPKILLYGPPCSGKTSILLDYLSTLNDEKVLYIDFKDPKFSFYDIIEEDVNSFIEENDIKYLALDHYIKDYFIELPTVSQIIIVSNEPYLFDDEFKQIKLALLDYEEFFSFQKRGNETQVFNQFLRLGTFPGLAIHPIPKEQYFLNFLHSNFDESEQKLLNVLAHFNATTVTTHQLYTYAKERYKISKDLIYKQISMLHQQGLIHYVSNFENQKHKKLFLFDFALAKYLSFSQNFPRQFETMIVLSLIKHNVQFNAFGLNSYITHNRTLIEPTAFETEANFWKKAHNKFSLYKKANIKKVYAITVNLQYEFYIENISFEALPFYEWVVINDEN